MKRPTVFIFFLVCINLCASAQDAIPGCDTARAWYYSVDGKYPLSSATLTSKAQTFLGTLNTNKASGYITIRFTINCRGLMANGIEVLQTDEKYQPALFNKTLTDRLTAFVRSLDKWSIASYENGKPLAYRAFMTFKLQDGKIVNVIP